MQIKKGDKAIVCESFYPFYSDSKVIRVGEVIYAGERYIISRHYKKRLFFWEIYKDFIIPMDHVFEVIDNSNELEVEELEKLHKL